jgi:hypothetical protein
LVSENPNWGAPRIHGELKMLGFDISERAVLRWMRKVPRDPEPARQWAALLRNHREVIAAMDFFTMPSLTFGVLYCFFVIHHDGGAFFSATSPVIRRPPGSLSNFVRHFRTIPRQSI